MRTVCVLVNFLLVLGLSKGDCDSKWPKCDRGPNTVCIRDEDCDPVAGCEDLSGRPAFRRWMIEIHNKLRNDLALGKEKGKGFTEAANMNALSYDMDLEYVAQCHINQCLFKHDNCRTTPKFPTHVGQNLYMVGGEIRKENQAKSLVQTWYDEIKDATPDVIDAYQSSKTAKIGHFTQVIWAETTHIGCGISKDKGGCYVACNYGVAGNMIDSPIYKKGPACSACPKGVKCNKDYPGLCGEITMGTVQARLCSGILVLTLVVMVL